MSSSELIQEQDIIPGLPDDVAFACLLRLHPSTHLAAVDVCKRWRHLLKSPSFSLLRKRHGLTRFYACFLHPTTTTSTITKQQLVDSFAISVFDSLTRSFHRLDSVLPTPLPLFCHVAGCGSKLVIMGGWDPVSYEPTTRVFIYDFLTREWRQGKDVPSTRSFFAIAALNDDIYIAGGHDVDKNALNSAWVYNVSCDTWTELTPMSESRDECQGLISGSQYFWVISGYDTETQGQFKPSAEVYDVVSSQWARIEDAWVAGSNPRSCAGVVKNKGINNVINWGELNSEVRVGTCVVELGDRVLVSGSVSQGAGRVFYLGKKKNVENGGGEFEKLLDVPEELLGFVQSGCCVEV